MSNSYSENSYTKGNFWWLSQKDVHLAVFQWFKSQQNRTTQRLQQFLRYAKLYDNADIIDMLPVPKGYDVNRDIIPDARMNVIESMIDTKVAKIVKNKPMPMFLTSGGDWVKQQKAKKLNKVCEGMFDQLGIDEKSEEALTHSDIFGTGFIKIFTESDEVKAEVVLPTEIFVDELESAYGCVRQIHQAKAINRDFIKEKFPQHEDAIALADHPQYDSQVGDSMDFVIILESWRMATKESKGRHTVCLSNCTLLDEEWDREEFPFSVIRANKRTASFWGKGCAERQEGIQIQINECLTTLSKSLRFIVPKVFIPMGDDIAEADYNNVQAAIVRYDKVMPHVGALCNIPPDILTALNLLEQKAYASEGVSMLSSRSEKPAGLNAAVALREYNDIETERFVRLGLAYERFRLHIAHLILDEIKYLHEKNGKFKITVPNKKFLETINWKDVCLEKTDYVMKCFPVSSLPRDPSGRIQTIQEMMQGGLISKDRGVKLLNFPDLDGIMNYETAQIEDIEATIADIVEKGEYEAPDPTTQNLAMGIEMMGQAFNYYKRQGAPDSTLEMMKNWVNTALAFKSQADQAAMAQQAAVQAQGQQGAIPQAMPASSPFLPTQPI